MRMETWFENLLIVIVWVAVVKLLTAINGLPYNNLTVAVYEMPAFFTGAMLTLNTTWRNQSSTATKSDNQA